MYLHRCAILIFILMILSLCAGCISYESPSQQTISTTKSTVQTTTTIKPSPTIQTTSIPPQTVPKNHMLTVSFIDVGQGDAIFLQSPNGKTMLIDAGPTNSASKVVTFLKNKGISSLDIVIATHPHEDHIGGMTSILNSFTVYKFIDIGYPQTTRVYEDMLNIIDQKNIPYITVKAGDLINWDATTTIRVINPQRTFVDNLNDNSIVLKLTYGTINFLFMGDAGKLVEDQIHDNIESEILKVSHHGSQYGTSPTFIRKVSPQVSVISVGADNPYGHPAKETLQCLYNAGSKVYRTDQVGTITISTDGNTYQIKTEKTESYTNSANNINSPTTIRTIAPLTTSSSAICDCSYDKYNCGDFSSPKEAQACYNYCKNIGKGDVHHLDRDKDGLACEG